jgi:hypothetical protein
MVIVAVADIDACTIAVIAHPIVLDHALVFIQIGTLATEIERIIARASPAESKGARPVRSE